MFSGLSPVSPPTVSKFHRPRNSNMNNRNSINNSNINTASNRNMPQNRNNMNRYINTNNNQYQAGDRNQRPYTNLNSNINNENRRYTTINFTVDLCYGDKIRLRDGREGDIKFIGTIGYKADEIWYGIHLKSNTGNCNGIQHNRLFFPCRPGHGLFAARHEIANILSYSASNGQRFCIGQRIKCQHGVGIIKFIGQVQTNHNQRTLLYGIELKKQTVGGHNGMMHKTVYFVCRPFHGIFLTPKDMIIYPKKKRRKTHKKRQHNMSNQNQPSSRNSRYSRQSKRLPPNIDIDTNNNNSAQQHSLQSQSPNSDNSSSGSNNEQNEEEIQAAVKNTNFDNILERYKRSNSRHSQHEEVKYNTYNPRPTASTPQPIQQKHSLKSKRLRRPTHHKQAQSLPNQHNLSPIFAPQRQPTNIHSTALDDNSTHDRYNNHNTQISSTPTPINTMRQINIYNKPLAQSLQVTPSKHRQAHSALNILSNQPYLCQSQSVFADAPAPPPHTNYNPLATPNNILTHSLSLQHSKSTPYHNVAKDSPIPTVSQHAPLKAVPDSPFDVRSTNEEFAKCASDIFSAYNNPRGLFKLLGQMTEKLKFSHPKHRVLDPQDPAVQRKVFKKQDAKDGDIGPESVKEWLRLLGFASHNESGLYVCPPQQPPISIIDAASNICRAWIVKCNNSRKALYNIRKYSKNVNVLRQEIKDSLRGKNIKLIHGAGNYANNKRLHTPSSGYKSSLSSLSSIPSIPESTPTTPHRAQSHTPSISEETDEETKRKTTEDSEGTEDEKAVDEDVDGENDRFALRELIWSVTHHKNTEHANVRDVLLLCHPVFLDTPQEIMSLLQLRFSEQDPCNNSYTHWEIQYRVTSFLQHWLRKYYYQDFHLNEDMKICLDEFLEKMRRYFEEKRDVQRGFKLPDMIEKTVNAQKKKLKEKGIIQEKENTKSKLNKILGLNVDDEDMKFDSIKNRKSAADKQIEKFYSENNKKVAVQLVLMSFKCFKGIEPRECLEQNWKGKEKEQRAPNILHVINEFNAMSNWIQLTILSANNASKRGKWITKWLRIGEILFELHDFQTLATIHGALTSQTIFRQQIAWKKVPAKYIIKFEEYKVVFHCKCGHSNLRKIHKETLPPMVPYAGVLLQVLFQIDEGNKSKKKDGSVNFSKLMRLHAAIQRITLLQNTSYEQLKTDSKLQEFISNCTSKYSHLTTNDLYKKSTHALNKDDPKRLQNKK